MKDYNEYNDDFYYCHDDEISDISVCYLHECCRDCPYYYAEEE